MANTIDVELTLILMSCCMGVVIIAGAIRKIKKERTRRKFLKEGKKWISYRKLLNFRGDLKRCPNCGENHLEVSIYNQGWTLGEPVCPDCGHVFFHVEANWRKGFFVVAYDECGN